nr:MAG TPA: hypothetical protein [Caudoviricetes sp.]
MLITFLLSMPERIRENPHKINIIRGNTIKRSTHPAPVPKLLFD